MKVHRLRMNTLVVAAVLMFASVIGLSPHTHVLAQGNQGNTPGEFAMGDVVVVTSATLNLREEPGRNSAIITSLEFNHQAEILEGPVRATGLEWYRIDTGAAADNIGWVAGDYLDLASAGAMFVIGNTVYVYDGPINLREDPGLTPIVGILPQDQIATITGGPVPADGYGWYELDIDGGGGDGWAAGEFLATYTGTPPVITPGDFPIPSYVFVNTSKLHLRSGASLDSPVLQTLRDGEIATVVGGPSTSDGYNWYQLQIGGDTGWAVGEFLTGGVNVTISSSAVVADGPINLRDRTNQNAAIVATLQPGALVTVDSEPIATGGTIWFAVTYDGTSGYVVGRYLGPA